MGQGGVYIIYNIHIFYMSMSLWHVCPRGWKISYIGGMRHLWERGEEPWASSEAAASAMDQQKVDPEHKAKVQH